MRRMGHPKARSGRWIAPLLGGLALVIAGCAQGTTSAVATATPQLQQAGVIRATVPIAKLSAPTGGSALFYGMAASDSAVWIFEPPLGEVLRVVPQTDTVVARVAVGKSDFGLVALGDDAVWVSGASGKATSDGPQTAKVFHINARTNTVVGVIDFPDSRISGVAATQEAAWVTNYDTNMVAMIDARTNEIVARVPTYAGPFGASYGAGSVWVCNYHDGQYGLTRWDPQTRQPIAQIDVGDAHGIWTWYPDAGLYRADPVTDRYVGAFASSGVAGVAVGGGSVWLANPESGELLRIMPTA